MEAAAVPRFASPAEAALWHTHGQRVYRYLLRLTGQHETADDLAQETFLRAIRDLRRSRMRRWASKHTCESAPPARTWCLWVRVSRTW